MSIRLGQPSDFTEGVYYAHLLLIFKFIGNSENIWDIVGKAQVIQRPLNVFNRDGFLGIFLGNFVGFGRD